MTSKKENTKKQQKHVETSPHYKSSERSAFVWEKHGEAIRYPLFFLSNAFAWTDQLVVHLASILALCAYLAGWIKSPSKKDALEKKALLPAGANTPTRHGRRLPTSPNPLIIAGPYVLRWRNSKVARSRSCGSFMVSHLQPDHSPSQLSNAQHDRLAFQNVQAPAAFSSWIPAPQHSLKVNPDFQDRIT